MTIINLKAGLRTLYRNRLYTLLNVLGLSIGMTCAMLIFLWVQFQVSFDRFHANGDRIHRVIQDQFYTNGEVFHVTATPSGLSHILKENIAGIEKATRYNDQQMLIQLKNEKMIENVQFVDPDFFTMFSFPLIRGNENSVFENTRSMVLSEKMAGKYFGGSNPMGETVLIDGKFPFTVTGVIKDNPLNTEIKCSFLIPYDFYKEMGVDVNNMGTNWITTYVQLTPGEIADSVNSTIEALKKKNYPQVESVFYLQPLKNIHLYWIWGGGPIKDVRLFSIIAALIIFIAAINFTNLSTAMAVKRYIEIGVKKSFGASRNILILQFLTETLILSFISLFVALIFTESLLPWYNSMLKTELRVDYNDWLMLTGFLGIMIITGLLSGAYPALFLSSFKPVKILKAAGRSHKRSVLRETLVVIQFGLALVLIVNAIIIKKQQKFLLHKDVGIQKENMLYIPLRGELKTRHDLLKTQLGEIPGIRSVCLGTHIPTFIWSNSGGFDWQGKPPEVDPLVSFSGVDYDFAKTFGIKMDEGEFYTENHYLDTNNAVINKTFAEIIGIKPILGEYIMAGGRKLKIIGVTGDFNFKPLSFKIEPLILYNSPDYNYVFCKVATEDLAATIHKIEDLHGKINSSFPFEYHFLNDEFDNLYANELRQSRIFNIFSFLAIFISCLGLFGLSAFMMTQRTKEIGIRKTIGASAVSVMLLFTRYYTRWVLVSFVIALPVSYYFIHNWLKNYAYHTSISWWVFALAGFIAFIIAIVTVGWQSWNSAKKNPVESLRYE